MSLIKMIARELDVELGEAFFIQIKKNSLIMNSKFYLNENGLFRKDDIIYKNEDTFLRMLIAREARVVKEEHLIKANIPVFGSSYYSYNDLREGEVTVYNWYNNFSDNCRLKLGIVFATQDEALRCKEQKILEIRKEQADRISYCQRLKERRTDNE